MIMCFFSFGLLILWITLTDFHMLNHLYVYGMKPTWSCWVIFLMCSWICIANIVLSISHECSWGILVFNSLSMLIFVWFAYQGDNSLVEFVSLSSVSIVWNNLKSKEISSLWNSDWILCWNLLVLIYFWLGDISLLLPFP